MKNKKSKENSVQPRLSERINQGSEAIARKMYIALNLGGLVCVLGLGVVGVGVGAKKGWETVVSEPAQRERAAKIELESNRLQIGSMVREQGVLLEQDQPKDMPTLALDEALRKQAILSPTSQRYTHGITLSDSSRYMDIKIQGDFTQPETRQGDTGVFILPGKTPTAFFTPGSTEVVNNKCLPSKPNCRSYNLTEYVPTAELTSLDVYLATTSPVDAKASVYVDTVKASNGKDFSAYGVRIESSSTAVPPTALLVSAIENP